MTDIFLIQNTVFRSFRVWLRFMFTPEWSYICR